MTVETQVCPRCQQPALWPTDGPCELCRNAPPPEPEDDGDTE